MVALLAERVVVFPSVLTIPLSFIRGRKDTLVSGDVCELEEWHSRDPGGDLEHRGPGHSVPEALQNLNSPWDFRFARTGSLQLC